MNNQESINVFFNDLRLNSGAIWVDNEAINFSAPQKFQNQETNDFIRQNKSQLISILKENNISSIDKFLNTEIIKDNTVTHFPLSPAQERLWFIEQYEEGTNAYHIPKVFELNEDTDIEGIRYALQQIVTRHQVLKSTIEQGDNLEYVIQRVNDRPLNIEEITIAETEDYKQIIQNDINRPFNLSIEYPVRVKFYTIQQANTVSEKQQSSVLLLVNIHHIAIDGWSMDIFQEELIIFYEAYIKKDKAFSLPDLEIQYKDYALWQRSYLLGTQVENQLSYWKEKLAGYQALELPTDYTRPNKVNYSGDTFQFELSKSLSPKLGTLAKEKRCTPYTILLAAFYILIHKLSRQEDIVIGTPIANRHRAQTANLVGFFVNTLVIRETVKPSFTADDLLENLNQNMLDGQKNQDLPFEKIVDELKIERDLSRHPVFQVLFRYQGPVSKQKVEKINQYLRLQNISSTYTAKFDLDLFVEDAGNNLIATIEYATGLFKRESIERLAKYYNRVLGQLVDNPGKRIGDYTLLNNEEYNQIVYEWNITDKYYPKGKTIHQLFEEQVEKVPDNIALAYNGQQLTYRELNEKSNQLARYIREEYEKRVEQELKPDTIIALYLDRSLEMVVGILAILKAGGAYVPLDPSFPEERINYLLEDTQTALILSLKQPNIENSIFLPEHKLVYINLSEEFYNKEEITNLPQNSTTTSLSYVVYTSGTTGKPKGVMVEHGAFSQFIYNFNDYLSDKLNTSKRNLLSLTNYVFDIFGLEYALPLTTGSQVTLSSIDKVSEQDFSGHQIIQQTPGSLLHLTANYSGELSDIICLVGGEALSPSAADQLCKSFGKVFNVYGPAETVIWSAVYEVLNSEKICIGKPLFNEQLFILDQSNNPVAIGVVGELHIGGSGLARGYLNLPELTQERFIQNHFATEADKLKGYTRLYKTGDLVRRLQDGNIEYIGRNDEQVKIRGYRIEPGEIEHALTRIPGIKQSCVLINTRKTKSGDDKYLVGYYVPDHTYVSDNDPAILNNWEHLYNAEYEKSIAETRIQADFSIWTSYITGELIPVAEMEEWRDNIVRIIRNLTPTNVLEIGVGSGLLMYPLLDSVKRFVGLDISWSVINRHLKYLENKEYDTAFHYLRADQLDQLPKDEFYDTIIINSVCQYFPSIHYFNEVLEKSMQKLSGSGFIFLGDIRNYSLHKQLIKDKLDYNGEHYTQQDIDRLALKENELLISPAYFTNLSKMYDHVKIDILERNASYTNELSKYRYDVVISVQTEITIDNDNYKFSKDLAGITQGKNTTSQYNIPYLNQLSIEAIHAKLSGMLPSYMLPDTFVAMESFPLTINGKLDKRALPEPDYTDDDHHTKPETDLEITLCEIYAGVLGIAPDQVSTHQNFFRMGGNSILSIQLKAKLARLEEFKHITVADLFKYNSINKLVESIRQDSQTVYKLQGNHSAANHEVAIIGASGAFSGVDNIDELWMLISKQQEGIRFYTEEECKQLNVDEGFLEYPDYVRVAGKVKDIEQFDPLFWEMSPNGAKQLDPQIRKFLEHCWLTLESAGYVQQRRENNIGVFAGSGNNNYLYDHLLHGEMADEINVWEVVNTNSKDALATQVAYLLGLSGPANAINTACSTGLVSVVEACKNLQLGTCNMALAGGVSLSMPDEIGYTWEAGMIVSQDGHCRTFDSTASGTTPGSGVGVVLLKRLEEAIKDKDTILGVIKGYATNNDGDRKTGYTAPSVTGQTECIINAQKMAGISADLIEYVECHGTATHLGDPIEVQALREAFAFNAPKGTNARQKTVLGAIKANIGHTDSAAGTAGLIKVLAMLQHQLIPGQVNFNEPNADLHLDQSSFEIIKENRPWPAHLDRQRLAAVSSFGIGGTNAHVIVGDYLPGAKKKKEDDRQNDQQEQGYIIPISARSRQSLQRYQEALLNYLLANNTSSIENIAYTCEHRRQHFDYRSAYCARNLHELMYKLKHDDAYAQTATGNENKIVFLFPGQGAQYTDMAKSLYDNEKSFREIVDQCIAIAHKYVAADVHEIMYPIEGSLGYNINDTSWTQLSLFIIEYAIARYLEHLGVHADAYIGHSIGEYVAATLSGVFSLEDAIEVVATRGQLMQAMQPGTMLSINAAMDTIAHLVKQYNCEVAVINSSTDIVVSGDDWAIQKLQQALEAKSIASVKLHTSHAYHSVMMEPAAAQFEAIFSDIKINKPRKTFISNLTGEIAGKEVTEPAYWCQQLRHTVQFAKGVNNLSKYYNHQISFIEVGPGKALSYFINQHKKADSYQSIQTIQLLPSAKEAKSTNPAAPEFLTCQQDLIALLWMNGIVKKANNEKLFENATLQYDLPNYQFEAQKYWIEKNKEEGSNNQLKPLPKDKWMSTPVWSAVSNLNKQDIRTKPPVFKNALIFIREDQLNFSEFSELSQRFWLIVLDVYAADIDDSPALDFIRINPGKAHHFEQLEEHLKKKDILFDAIIHLSSIDNVSDLEESLYYSFYSLFLIRQQLMNGIHLENLLILTNGLAQITNEDTIRPGNGTLVGAVRNINHELIGINSRIIDIGHHYEGIPSYIIQVINRPGDEKAENLVAIRFGKLWVENFEKVGNSLSQENMIDDGDTILITGGLGGIALTTAQYISSKHKVKFILVSRRNIDTVGEQDSYTRQKIELIEKVRANGSSVHIYCADISDRAQMCVLMEEVEQAHGYVTGVIHTAGIPPVSLEKHNLADIKNAFKAKVYGIDNILNHLSPDHLRFVAATSSLASIMGDIHRIEYCAANSYLDYLSVDKLRFKKTKVISINWPAWSDIGMVREHAMVEGESLNSLKGIEKLMHLNSVSHREGTEMFYRLINQTDYGQVAVSRLDLTHLKNKLFKKVAQKSLNQPITILEKEYTEMEYKTAQIFCEILGVQQISIHDDFFRVGGNSILAIQVSHRMSRLFQCDVKVGDLFKFKNISSLQRNVILESKEVKKTKFVF